MKSISLFIISACVLLGNGSCGVHLPLAHARLSLPADWKHAAGFPVASPTRDLSRWWHRFEDPTLNRVIAEALRNSPDMAAAAARVREFRARRNASAAALFPSLGSSASAGTSAAQNDSGGSHSNSSYSAGLNASWEVDLFGKNRSTLAAAAADLGATEENFHSVQAALASEIAIAYTNLRVAQASLDVLHQTIKSRDETSKLAAWRTQAGEADSLESSQALSSLEQARAAVPALEQTIAQTRNQLTLLSGKLPGSLDGLLASGKQTIPNPSRVLAVGIPADTIRQRPDVRVAGYQLLAAAANSRAADAERFPTINLTGTLGLNTLGTQKLFNPQSATAGIIAGISSPIFDAGRIQANIAAQTAVEAQTYQTYRAAVLTALSEVEDALIACRRTGERLEILERAAAAAREAAKLARQRYAAGVVDILTVLDTERALLGLESDLFTIRADRSTAYIQLYKALGGGWS